VNEKIQLWWSLIQAVFKKKRPRWENQFWFLRRGERVTERPEAVRAGTVKNWWGPKDGDRTIRLDFVAEQTGLTRECPPR